MKTIRNTLAAVLGIASVLSANVASADRFQRWLCVVNTSNVPVYSVQITHVDDGTWGRDLLGNRMIPPGGAITVEPDVNDGYCRFDIRIVYENGYDAVYDRVNLCVEEQIHV